MLYSVISRAELVASRVGCEITLVTTAAPVWELASARLFKRLLEVNMNLVRSQTANATENFVQLVYRTLTGLLRLYILWAGQKARLNGFQVGFRAHCRLGGVSHMPPMFDWQS